jgi:hypothetical protein
MHPNLIDAFYRFVASGSTSGLRSSGRFATVRYSASRFGVVNGADKPHDHGSATSDLG